MKISILLAVLFTALTAHIATSVEDIQNPRRSVELSHSGGTDKCGCHYNRKTGEYHCHKRKKRGGDCPA